MQKTHSTVMGKWGVEWSFHSLVIIFIGALILIAAYLTTDNKRILENEGSRKSLQSCDLFSGRWVYDNKSYPLYRERECKFMLDEFACEKFGRKDSKYQHWRWQPHECDLPRFNARKLLEKLRGKRLVFVGDSLNRNQWVSMVCLVESSIPKQLKSRHLNSSLFTFKATEYNASIDFYWAPFLVESNCDDPFHHHVKFRTVKIHAIERHARHWIDADILIFDSYIWWLDSKIKVLWEFSESKSFKSDGVREEAELLERYEMGLKTWADWVETHVNITRTQLFFVSISSTHLSCRGEEWGKGENQNCFSETEPILEEGYWGSLSNPKMMKVVEATADRMRRRGLKVKILNITQLSEYRKDGHPSIYRRQWVPLTAEQLSKPSSYADCGHWCLPGVPDVWNELLCSYLSYY
ncbi:hypothetical protein NMG60_11000128 [Bertholletia excelsa]